MSDTWCMRCRTRHRSNTPHDGEYDRDRLRRERHFERFGTWPGPECWLHGADCEFRNSVEALAAREEHDARTLREIAERAAQGSEPDIEALEAAKERARAKVRNFPHGPADEAHAQSVHDRAIAKLMPAQREALKANLAYLQGEGLESAFVSRQRLERKLAEAVAGLALVETLLERDTNITGTPSRKILEIVRELRKAAES